ncbi:hypothetical protein D9M71_482180 [compost metagenome]
MGGIDIQATGLDQRDQQRHQAVLLFFGSTLSTATLGLAIGTRAKVADQFQWQVRCQPGRRWLVLLAAATCFTFILDKHALGRMVGGAGIVLEEQGAGTAVEGDIHHRQGIETAVTGQPLPLAADFHQQLIDHQQPMALQAAFGKTAGQDLFGRGEGAHQGAVLFDDSHGGFPGQCALHQNAR